MMSLAYRILKKPVDSAGIGVVVLIAAALSAGLCRAQTGEGTSDSKSAVEAWGALAESSRPFADRFPNLVLRTHEGRNVRFYDDLLKDKVVLINFMYATCKER